MNKRAIVNVATGEFYCKMQDRLRNSFLKSVDFVRLSDDDFQKHDLMRGGINNIDLLLWRDCLPAGSRSHEESPYGFKVHAIKAAYEMGYTSILWLDSPAYAVKEDISPIFDKIEKEGYYAMSHIDPLENWVGNKSLERFNLKREDLKGLNCPSGTCYGFDFKKQIPLIPREGLSTLLGSSLFTSLAWYEDMGYFKNETISEGGWHRHDEAILALLLKFEKLPVFTFDPLFQSDSPECVIKSGG